MRRFFSLRSSASSTGNSNTASPAPNNKKDVTVSTCNANDVSQSPQDTILKPCNWAPDNDSLKPCLRRSHSFSSEGILYDKKERFSRFSSNLRRSSLNHDNTTICAASCQLSTPERSLRKRRDQAYIQSTHDLEVDTSGPREIFSSGNSSCCSTIPLRCRAGHRMRSSFSTEIPEFHIDVEERIVKPNQSYCSHASGAEAGRCLADKNMHPSSVRPPRMQYARSSLPSYDKENLRSYSFREINHEQHQSWSDDDIKPASPCRQTRRDGKLSHAFSETFLTSQDCESRTTTTLDDIHDDLSEAQLSLTSNDFSERHIHEVTSPYEDAKDYCTDEVLSLREQKPLLGNAIMVAKIDNIISTKMQVEDTDEELQIKLQELEQKLMLQHEENPEMVNYRTKGSNLTTMFQIIEKINEDRKCLAFELSSQIKSRLSERDSARELFKNSNAELDTRTRRLEKEKNEIQLNLEKELDRRSNGWSLKFEKFQSEEQRLRERVRELAEQNVALQREISSLQVKELEPQSRILNSERQMNDLTASLEDMKTKNHDLQQSLSEVQLRFTGAEEDRDCLSRCYKDKERENKELQNVAVKLQRTCSEQEKTISGLRQGLSDDLHKKTLDGSDIISRLQREQLRLTGVEQILRKEVESCRFEIESLRLENISLIGRLQGSGNYLGSSLIKLDQEFRTQVDYLQNQGLSLLHKSSCFFGELLEFVKCKHYEPVASKDVDGFSVDDFILKHQSLKRGTENLRRNLKTTLNNLYDKSSLEGLQQHWETFKDAKLRQLKAQVREDEMELNMRAEALLSRVLKENLCCRELQYEQLQADFATSVRARDFLQTANQRLQDELSCLTHKMEDLNNQILKKDETIAQLDQEIQVSLADLTAVQCTLQKVSKERDEVWEEVQQLRKTNMRLDNEISCLSKKIEVLDEDILLKEGQISILKDSMEKTFDFIYSPKETKEFDL